MDWTLDISQKEGVQRALCPDSYRRTHWEGIFTLARNMNNELAILGYLKILKKSKFNRQSVDDSSGGRERYQTDIRRARKQ